MLELLAGDLHLAVRLAVEYNQNCLSELVELVKSQHDLVSNWNADVEQLMELGESRWGWVRLAVAQNPYTPVQTLKLLSEQIKIINILQPTKVGFPCVAAISIARF